MNAPLSYAEEVLDAAIHVRSWTPPAPRGCVLVVHGLGDHAGRYRDIGEAGAAAGLAVLALDLPGHGRSAGQRGHVRGFDDFLHAVHRVRSEAQDRHPGLPFFLVGQSMGGLVVLRYLQQCEPQPRGAVLCSPWIETAMAAPRWKLAIAPLAARILPRLPFNHGLAPEHLTRDADRVAAYRADPLVHGLITPATYRAVNQAMARVVADAGRVRCAVLALLSGADLVVSTDAAVRLVAALPGDEVTVEILPGHYHELMNEPDRQQTIDRICAWLLERV